jgi:hypothetical protein
MIMGTLKFDNTKTSVTVQVTFTHAFTTGANSALRPSGVEAKTGWFLMRQLVSNHWQETQENSSEVHHAEQT